MSLSFFEGGAVKPSFISWQPPEDGNSYAEIACKHNRARSGMAKDAELISA